MLFCAFNTIPVRLHVAFSYRFDPNVKVQLAMTNIWKSLVSNTEKMVGNLLGLVTSNMCRGMVACT